MSTLTHNPEINTDADTPMLRQYLSIKATQQDAILFFRLGDFYEMFLDDAIVASRVLSLTLTGRGKEDNRIPMCGIPYHAAESYIAKLVKHGYKVAICEQTEEATAGKGLTKREVVKIVTPGTVTANASLNEKDNNYLLSVFPLGHTHFGSAVLDITTGEFRVFKINDANELDALLTNFPIREVITTTDCPHEFPKGLLINRRPFTDVKTATLTLEKFFTRFATHAFGIEDVAAAFPAAQAILDYIQHTHQQTLSQITRLLPWKRDRCIALDKVTMKNLELTENRDQHSTHTLFWVLDYTKTAMGARHLKLMIKNPLTDAPTIEKRLDAIDSLLHDLESKEGIRDALSTIYDIERLITRIVTEHNNPRDLIALKDSLIAIGPLATLLENLPGEICTSLATFFKKSLSPNSSYTRIITLIQTAIKAEPPVSLKDGKIINPGFSQELDALNAQFADIRHWIQNLEAHERLSTGIKSLKVGFNKVFGYYIEISNANRDPVPDTYIRKQTLTNAERYITPELKEKENILLHAEEKQIQLEAELYKSIIANIRQYTEELQLLARHIARLDSLQSLATAAQKHHYTRPSFTSDIDQALTIIDGRHPILERNSQTPFIPNNIHLNTLDQTFILLTGPNMAGKSTLMRQIALTVIMAQMGSFVPAKHLELSIVDKLFTRIGALDNLYFGQSTFMVEMLETATILHNATSKSLIILDEVGRGTATYDGLSIAAAVSEHIHNHIKARTLFATHYHELTALEGPLKKCKNYKMDVQETTTGIVFTYKCLPGPADKSYGIHVAQMAGLSKSIISRATQILAKLEQSGSGVIDAKNPLQLQLF